MKIKLSKDTSSFTKNIYILDVMGKFINGHLYINLNSKNNKVFHIRERQVLETRSTETQGVYNVFLKERALYFYKWRLSKWKLYDVVPDFSSFESIKNL